MRMSSSILLKLFIVGIEPPFSKMSLVVVLTEAAVELAGLVAVVNGCRIRLAAAEVVLVDRLIGAVALAGLVPVVNGCRLRLAGAVVLNFVVLDVIGNDKSIALFPFTLTFATVVLPL